MQSHCLNMASFAVNTIVGPDFATLRLPKKRMTSGGDPSRTSPASDRAQPAEPPVPIRCASHCAATLAATCIDDGASTHHSFHDACLAAATATHGTCDHL